MSTGFLDKIVKQKGREIAQGRKVIAEGRLAELARQRTDFRPFFEALANSESGVNIIAEIKRASPSKGDICTDLEAAATASRYENGGAAAVSVLTDPTYFKGHLDDLKAARSACRLPVLRKEFIISRYQVYEAAAAGADAILLIVRILSRDKLMQLYSLCRELGMDALVEIHTAEDAGIVADSDIRLVGINNRNLDTFATDIAVAMDLVSRLRPDQVPVAASGIAGPDASSANSKLPVPEAVWPSEPGDPPQTAQPDSADRPHRRVRHPRRDRFGLYPRIAGGERRHGPPPARCRSGGYRLRRAHPKLEYRAGGQPAEDHMISSQPQRIPSFVSGMRWSGFQPRFIHKNEPYRGKMPLQQMQPMDIPGRVCILVTMENRCCKGIQ